MAKLAMDRIFERVNELNDKWIELNDKLQRYSLVIKTPTLKEIYEEYVSLRTEFANIITLGQDENWRLIAKMNGVSVPDDDEES